MASTASRLGSGTAGLALVLLMGNSGFSWVSTNALCLGVSSFIRAELALVV
jgi:hypothetical protein